MMLGFKKKKYSNSVDGEEDRTTFTKYKLLIFAFSGEILCSIRN